MFFSWLLCCTVWSNTSCRSRGNRYQLLNCSSASCIKGDHAGQWASLSPMSQVPSSNLKTQNCSSQKKSLFQSLPVCIKEIKGWKGRNVRNVMAVSKSHPKSSKGQKSKTCRPAVVRCPQHLCWFWSLISGSDIGLCQAHSHLATTPFWSKVHGLLPYLAICEQEVKVIHVGYHLQMIQLTSININ
jgi:hypothetical protein